MATRKQPQSSDPRLPGEAELARLYDAGPQDEPSAALDANILAAARKAAQTPKHRTSFGARWAIPASAAAVMLLGIGVLWQMQESGLVGPADMASIPAPAPAQTPPTTLARDALEQAPAKRLAKAQPAAPSASAPVAGGLVAPLATDAVEAKTERYAKAQEATPARANATLSSEMRAEQPKVAAMAAAPRVRGDVKQEADTMTLQAHVTAIRISGQAGAYDFSVTLRSPDKGCQQYADWWEVVSEDGQLLYRRVLLHSHVDEQPFTRSGGPVPIQATTPVWVRAHMNTGGYGAAFKGSVQTGFAAATPAANFAAHLATQEPLPTGCDF